ncbi:MAG: hypothetical protein JKY54_03085 [Flavobacteriales bacterium]|nr:hypothetical protein [Flavobacteriales bacterium]
MTELKITISEDLNFTVNCKNDEANEVLNKILKNFNKGEDITVRYWSEEDILFNHECFKDIYFNQENPFYGKLKSIKIYDKNLTDY